VVAISVDSAEDSRALAEKIGIPFPLLSDPGAEVADLYGIAVAGDTMAIPTTLIVLPDRTIHWKKVGETAADRPAVRIVLEQLDAALAGQ
jgi:peroxiredoxin